MSYQQFKARNADGTICLAEDFDLDALLDESLAAKDIAAGIADKRRRAANLEISTAEREALRQQILAWEALYEWTNKAVVVIFETQTCDCGAAADHFQGVYMRQIHRERINTRRLVLWSDRLGADASIGMPRERFYRQLHVPVCPYCAAGQGFDLTHDFEETLP